MCAGYMRLTIMLTSCLMFLRTEVGLLAEEIVASGGLLPDDIMLKVITSRLDLLHNKVSACHDIVLESPQTDPLLALDPGRLSTDSGAREAFRHSSSVRATCPAPQSL